MMKMFATLIAIGFMACMRAEQCPVCQGNAGKITNWPFSGCDVSCGAKDEYGTCCCRSGVGACPSADAEQDVMVGVKEHCPVCQGNAGKITNWPFSGCDVSCG